MIDQPIITSATTPPPTTAPDTTSSSTSTTVEELNRMPLTGQILEDDVEPPQRPALVVKIDNVPPAWPQSGLNKADIVFEEIINDNATRFAVVFHSQDGGLVGPVRSGRLQDIDLLGIAEPSAVRLEWRQPDGHRLHRPLRSPRPQLAEERCPLSP